MEGREEMSSGGVTVVAEQGGLKSEYPPNPRQSGDDMVMASSTATGLVSMDTSMAFGPVKKKRGRPRKYGPDGSVILALTPLSLSAPGIFSDKRGRGRPPGSGQKQKLEALGEGGAYSAGGNSAGGNFTPHVIPIAAGERMTRPINRFKVILAAAQRFPPTMPDQNFKEKTEKQRVDPISWQGIKERSNSRKNYFDKKKAVKILV